MALVVGVGTEVAVVEDFPAFFSRASLAARAFSSRAMTDS
jgi:hypothetical protein